MYSKKKLTDLSVFTHFCDGLAVDEDKFVWNIAPAATVQAIYSETGFLDEGVDAGVDTSVGVVLDKTSYYAESGGQV